MRGAQPAFDGEEEKMEFAKIFITLVALINPIGAIPAFISLTEGQSDASRRQTIRTATLTTFIVIAVSAIGGQYLLAAFGITIPSLQVGGGALLFLVAVSMFNAQVAPSRSTPEEQDEASARNSIAVVPLTIPLLTGPGTMSTVIIYADRVHGVTGFAMLIGAGVLVAACVWIAFNLAGPISRLAGRTGLNIMTRIMGLVLAALAVEFVAAGVKSLFA